MAQPLYRTGQVELVRSGVLAATVFTKGDMVAMSGSDANFIPVSTVQWDTDLATTQAAIADVFVGITWDKSSSTDTDAINVDMSADSVYEFDVPSGTFTLGQSLGPDQDGSNQSVLSNKLEGAVVASSVARSFEEATSAVTRLLVKFSSAYNTSSSNANASMG